MVLLLSATMTSCTDDKDPVESTENDQLTVNNYVLPATGQANCYDDVGNVISPAPGSAFYGQDANYLKGAPMSYTDNGDSTITDNVTDKAEAIYTQGGSSLAGSAVQGAIAGEAAADYAKRVDLPTISKSKTSAVQEEILAPLRRDSGYGPAWVTQTLQGIMIPNFVIYIKKERILRAALAYVEELRDHHMPMLRAADMHELRLAHETANMIVSAEMKLKASLMRTESRCSHYRLDYPDLDDVNWRVWINISKGSDGSMNFEKQPFGSWPA